MRHVAVSPHLAAATLVERTEGLPHGTLSRLAADDRPDAVDGWVRDALTDALRSSRSQATVADVVVARAHRGWDHAPTFTVEARLDLRWWRRTTTLHVVDDGDTLTVHDLAGRGRVLGRDVRAEAGRQLARSRAAAGEDLEVAWQRRLVACAARRQTRIHCGCPSPTWTPDTDVLGLLARAGRVGLVDPVVSALADGWDGTAAELFGAVGQLADHGGRRAR